MKLITPPEPPFTLAEAKAHLRVDHDDDDDLIAIYMAAAVSAIDGPNGLTKKAILAQTWETAFDAFPSAEIRLPLMPLQSVTWVKYLDSEGGLQTIGAENYEADTFSAYGWIVPVDGYSWPSPLSAINAVTVRWVAGGDVCPPDLKAAMLLMLGHFYANREAAGPDMPDELPLGVRALCGGHRRYVLV